MKFYGRLVLAILMSLSSVCSLRASVSPSEEYLKVISWKKVQKKFAFSDAQMTDLKNLTYEKLIPREKEHSGNYYVFYHAQKREGLVLYDFYNMLYQALYKTEIKDFGFLRPSQTYHKRSETAQQFLDRYSNNIDDTEQKFAKRLLSVNTSFPGNLDPWQSSFCYYGNDCSYQLPDQTKLFYGYLTSLCPGIDDGQQERKFVGIILKKLSDLAKVVAACKASYGHLFQIFIPKKEISQCVYLSESGGIPDEGTLHNWDDQFKKKLGISDSLHMILERATKKPHTIEEQLTSLQARLLLREDIFGHLSRGIKIYNYHHIFSADLEAYTEQLRSLVAQIVEFYHNREDRNGVYEEIVSGYAEEIVGGYAEEIVGGYASDAKFKKYKKQLRNSSFVSTPARIDEIKNLVHLHSPLEYKNKREFFMLLVSCGIKEIYQEAFDFAMGPCGPSFELVEKLLEQGVFIEEIATAVSRDIFRPQFHEVCSTLKSFKSSLKLLRLLEAQGRPMKEEWVFFKEKVILTLAGYPAMALCCIKEDFLRQEIGEIILRETGHSDVRVIMDAYFILLQAAREGIMLPHFMDLFKKGLKEPLLKVRREVWRMTEADLGCLLGRADYFLPELLETIMLCLKDGFDENFSIQRDQRYIIHTLIDNNVEPEKTYQLVLNLLCKSTSEEDKADYAKLLKRIKEKKPVDKDLIISPLEVPFL